MRPFILSICILIGTATGAIAAGNTQSDIVFEAAAALKPTIRLAQNRNRRPIGPPERDSVIEGCGVRDALCVANRLMRQMERQVRGQRRRQIDDLGKLMQRACGTTPKDVICTGEFMSRALRVVTGRDDGPGPIVRERGRGGPGPVGQRPEGRTPVGGIACVRSPRGLFVPTRLRGNRSFGERGFQSEFGYGSCNWAIRNMNQEHRIACTNHSYGNVKRFIPQSMQDGYAYGWGMTSSAACVDAVNGISRGAICATQRGVGYRILDIRSRSMTGRAIRSLNGCLAELERQR